MLRSGLKLKSESQAQTLQIGRDLAGSLKSNTILALLGDLGAGKTTLIKGIVEALSQTPSHEVASPTFTYLTIYEAPLPLYHFDLYRLEGIDDFLRMGFDDYLEAGGICLIEWSERIAGFLPPHTLYVHLAHAGPTTRTITINEKFV